jgi:hypothetical protein
MKLPYKLLFLFVFFANSVLAQSPLWTTLIQDTHGKLTEGVSVAVDQHGYSYGSATGYYTDSVYGLIIAKCDSVGDTLWTKVARCNASEYALGTGSTVTDWYGDVYISGYFYRTDSLVIDNDTLWAINKNLFNSFIIKLDPAGNLLFARVLSAGFSGCAPLVIEKKDNLYFLGNYATPTLTLDTFVLHNFYSDTTASISSDMFLAKLSPDGRVLNAISLGGTNSEIENAIAIDDSNNVIICGSFYSNDLSIGGTLLPNSSMNPALFWPNTLPQERRCGEK